MTDDKNSTAAIDKSVYIIHNEDFKTTPELKLTYNLKNGEEDEKKENTACIAATGTFLHYLILIIIVLRIGVESVPERAVIFVLIKPFGNYRDPIGGAAHLNLDIFQNVYGPILFRLGSFIVLGLASWGLLWFAFGNEWSWNGHWFKPAVVVVIAWATGEVLQMTTTLPPLIAALLTGIIARNVGYLDMRHYTEVDSFMRKIYPVIILGKGSLGWNLSYMKKNWKQVASLGVLPWTADVVTFAVCMNMLLGYPWLWGFLLGSFLASVSCPIIMPTVQRLTTGKNLSQNWPQLVCTAGGTDTALSVGVFGVIHSFMTYDGDDVYRYIRAVLALFLGVVVGVSCGSLAKYMPHCRDAYVTELRILFVVIAGLFVNFLTTYYGWGGTGGIAVLACNATAARHWAKDGWKLNNNPASTAYRVMWSTVEPALFAFTGTFFVFKSSMLKVMLIGLAILFICVLVRLAIAYLVCTKLTIRERLFVCCTWIPKSIVEAVLCPVAINALISRGDHDEMKMEYAETMVRLTVQAILVTTPVGFLLTQYLGPILLREKEKKYENESEP